MTQRGSEQARKVSVLGRLADERTLRNLRLGAGIVLFVFVVMHLANLSLALISLETAERGRFWFMLAWRNPLGQLLLYGSIVVHVALALRALYRRRTLRMPVREAAQIALGLLIPALLAEHVTGTRLFPSLSGFDADYAFVVRAIWVYSPGIGVLQVVGLVVVWVHACLGLHFVLRFRAWYPAAQPYLLVFAALVPTMALLGFVDAGETVSAMGEPLFGPGVDPDAIRYAFEIKEMATTAIYGGMAFLIAGVLVLRWLRQTRERRNLVEIRYQDGQTVRIPRGYSVLEASRIGGIPHYSVCGGRGRCSTCRIRVVEGLDQLPPPEQIERLTLSRIGAAPDIRLACQARPTAPVKVLPLLAADREKALREAGIATKPGREQEIAVLFCDIRSFTALSDRRLPFDVVFLLNRYFAVVGRAVEAAGGRLDKFIGDGAMALFGLDGRPDEACRQALSASAAILAELDQLSAQLQGEIPAPLRVAIGVHVGPAIVGMMGYGSVMGVTAIGDTVNVASRLESAAKEFDASLVVSQAAVRLSGLDLSGFESRKIGIRGSAQPLDVTVIPHGAVPVLEPVAARPAA